MSTPGSEDSTGFDLLSPPPTKKLMRSEDTAVQSPSRTWPRMSATSARNGADAALRRCKNGSPLFRSPPPHSMPADEDENGSASPRKETPKHQPNVCSNTATPESSTPLRRLPPPGSTSSAPRNTITETTTTPAGDGGGGCCKKPDCSYAVLIGIALRAAEAAGSEPRLPVVEIYAYIEKEFPYFRRCATTGWKNCVRHCLSFGQFFRKTERSDTTKAITTAKRNTWEVVPSKKPLLERDIQAFILDQCKKLYPSSGATPKNNKSENDDKGERRYSSFKTRRYDTSEVLSIKMPSSSSKSCSVPRNGIVKPTPTTRRTSSHTAGFRQCLEDKRSTPNSPFSCFDILDVAIYDDEDPLPRPSSSKKPNFVRDNTTKQALITAGLPTPSINHYPELPTVTPSEFLSLERELAGGDQSDSWAKNSGDSEDYPFDDVVDAFTLEATSSAATTTTTGIPETTIRALGSKSKTTNSYCTNSSPKLLPPITKLLDCSPKSSAANAAAEHNTISLTSSSSQTFGGGWCPQLNHTAQRKNFEFPHHPPLHHFQQLLIDSNEEEVEVEVETPFINPKHPLVSWRTLNFINGGHHVARKSCSKTSNPNSVTYTVAPTISPASRPVSDICTPTSSGLTGPRMSHSLISLSPSIPKYHKLSGQTPIHQSPLAQIVKATSLSSLRRHRPSTCSNHSNTIADSTPPEIRPVLRSGHHPTLFLPSHRFFTTLSYERNRERRQSAEVADEDDEEEEDEEEEEEEEGRKQRERRRREEVRREEERKVPPLRLKRLRHNSIAREVAMRLQLTQYEGNEHDKDTNILDRFQTITTFFVANANQNEPENTIHNNDSTPVKNSMNSFSMSPRYTNDYHDDYNIENNSDGCLLGNGQTMLSSAQTITSLINGVVDHAPFNKQTGSEEMDTEVVNEWMESTIAREEEVTSSEFEEVTSSNDLCIYLPQSVQIN